MTWTGVLALVRLTTAPYAGGGLAHDSPAPTCALVLGR